MELGEDEAGKDRQVRVQSRDRRPWAGAEPKPIKFAVDQRDRESEKRAARRRLGSLAERHPHSLKSFVGGRGGVAVVGRNGWLRLVSGDFGNRLAGQWGGVEDSLLIEIEIRT